MPGLVGGGLDDGALKTDDAPEIFFEEDQVVQLGIHEVTVDEKYGHIFLHCIVATDGEFKDQEVTVSVRHKPESPFMMKNEILFGKAFFTKEELLLPAGPPMSKLNGRLLEAKALKPYEGKTYTSQTFVDFRDLGDCPEGLLPF